MSLVIGARFIFRFLLSLNHLSVLCYWQVSRTKNLQKKDCTNRFLRLLCLNPITIPDPRPRLLEGAAGLLAGAGACDPLAAAPMTVVDLLLEAGWDLLAVKSEGAAAPTADWDLGKGLLTSAPLAAAPMTNFLSGSGAAGNEVPADPITNCKKKAILTLDFVKSLTTSLALGFLHLLALTSNE